MEMPDKKEFDERLDLFFNSMGSVIGVISKQAKEVDILIKKESPELIRLLNCHLVLEYMIDKVLEQNILEYNPRKANLTFNQKVELLPTEKKIYKTLIPGIKEINSIRNKFVHNLNVVLTEADLKKIAIFKKAYSAYIKKEVFEPIDMIESFTQITCTLLIFYTKELKEKYEILTRDFKNFDTWVADIIDEGAFLNKYLNNTPTE